MKPAHFQLFEMLPCNFYNAHYPHYGEKLWTMFDCRILETIQSLRDLYGKMVVNTWHYGGRHEFRGWRPSDCIVGVTISQHKFGRAVDLVPIETSTNHVRHEIIADTHPYAFRHITAIEDRMPWLHIDCRSHNKLRDGILVI